MATPEPTANAVMQPAPRRGLANGWIIGGFAAACVIAMPITFILFIVSVMVCDGTASQCAAANSNSASTSGWLLGGFLLVTVVGIIALLVVGLIASRDTKPGRTWRVIALVGMLLMPFIGVAVGYAAAAATVH